MFLEPQELKSLLYDYQIEEITQGDDAIVISAIDTAVSEVESYLASRYDTQAIFSKRGRDRSPLVLSHVRNIAVWHILQLSNVDAIYERHQTLYNQSVDFLNKVAEGLLSPRLPYIVSPDGTPPGTLQISSNPKFTHNF